MVDVLTTDLGPLFLFTLVLSKLLITNMYPLDPGVNGWVPVQDIYSLASGRERNLCMTLPSQCRLSGCGSRSYIAQLWGFHPGVQWNLKICSIEKCPQLCI